MVGDDLSEKGKPPVRVFALKNEAREGMTGEVFLGIKELIFHPGKIVLYWTIPI